MSTEIETFKKDIFLSGDMARTSSGDLQTIQGLANYKLALFHRLITVPGSYVYRPGYGVGISRYQNAPSSFALQQKLATLIREQFLQDPRTESVGSIAINSEDGAPQKTEIIVSVTPIGYTEQKMTFTPFNEGNT